MNKTQENFIMNKIQEEFIDFSIKNNILLFGSFETKSKRISPYFFNAGAFNTGFLLKELGRFYAKTIIEKDIKFDMLFGPSYKGIPLVVSIAIALHELGENYPYAFNRKEVKDHGEGGSIVGSPLKGRVLIIDDVITSGMSISESVDIIKANGAIPYEVLIALDRQEKGSGESSAVREVILKHGIPVNSIANLDNIIDILNSYHSDEYTTHRLKLILYKHEYGSKE